MKYLRSFLLFLSAAFIISSCQKELSFEEGTARGSLKKASGDCLGANQVGTFKKDTLLTAGNYVDIQVDIIQTGTYVIKTDTLNGYSFSATGIIAVEGVNTIRLLASGRPVIADLNIFTVKFDTTSCQINIVVTGTGGATAAKFTLAGSPSNCTGAKQSNNFYATIPTNSANRDTVFVNVTQAGTYNISTGVAINGLQFSASGTLAVGNNVPIILEATGTPSAQGTNTFPLITSSPNTVSNCGFTINTQAAPAAATYTFNCATANVQGTYQANSAMTVANKMTIDINVATPGSYNITSTMNGVTFSKAAVLPATPAVQTITLDATGTAGASVGVVNFILAGGGGPNCSVPVTFTAAPTPASYTFNCPTAIVLGTYQANSAMTPANSITIDLTVTAGGPYTITTTMNGVTFSKSSTLPATPLVQTITLNATGTSGSTVGNVNFTLTGGGGPNCIVPVTFTSAPVATGIFRAKIDGVLTDFNLNDNADGFYFLPNTDLLISGDGTLPISMSLNIQKSNGSITSGTYVNTLAGATSGFYLIFADYTDATNTSYSPRGFLSFPTPPDNFTIVITTLNATRVIGTFNGTTRLGGTGTSLKIITEGVFDLPIN